MNKVRVCHISSVHYRYDTRILHRECASLADRGFEVHLLVLNQEEDLVNGVQIHNVSAPVRNRLERMWRSPGILLPAALELDADLYHFHDPELLRLGRRLQKAGKKVIFDVHEHVPNQIRTKKYMPVWLREPVARWFAWYEARMVAKMDAVVTATDLVRDRLRKHNPLTIAVNNYPRKGTFLPPFPEKTHDLVYVGLINRLRGIREMLDALLLLPGKRLCLIGYFEDAALEAEMHRHPAWPQVDFVGRKNREEVAELLSKSRIGIVTFLPAPNHNKNQPNKLFEYMAASLPVVCSNLERWEEIVQHAQCGYCADPTDPAAIAAACNRLLNNPEEAARLGARGCEVLQTDYNWEVEEDRLVALYHQVLSH